MSSIHHITQTQPVKTKTRSRKRLNQQLASCYKTAGEELLQNSSGHCICSSSAACPRYSPDGARNIPLYSPLKGRTQNSSPPVPSQTSPSCKTKKRKCLFLKQCIWDDFFFQFIFSEKEKEVQLLHPAPPPHSSAPRKYYFSVVPPIIQEKREEESFESCLAYLEARFLPSIYLFSHLFVSFISRIHVTLWDCGLSRVMEYFSKIKFSFQLPLF